MELNRRTRLIILGGSLAVALAIAFLFWQVRSSSSRPAPLTPEVRQAVEQANKELEAAPAEAPAADQTPHSSRSRPVGGK